MTLAKSDDGAQIRYAYDQGPHALGRLTAIAQDAGYPLLQWTYNAQGRVATETLTDLPLPSSPPLTLRQGYVYDAAGRVAERIYPSGQKVTYTYDGSGRLASIAYGGTPVLQAIAYQPFGDPNGWTWGNGTRHERRFDNDGRIVSYPVGSELRQLSYDAASRITDMTHSASAPKPPSFRAPPHSSRARPAPDQHFDYDLLDRLVRSVGSQESRVYRYDANGNRLELSLNGERSLYSVSATGNRLASVTGRSVRNFSYDAAGNTLSDGVASFRYDARGRLVAATRGHLTTAYIYNGKGERVAKKGRHLRGGAIYFAYDEAGQLIGEYDATGTPILEIVYLGRLPVAVVRDDALYYIHADHLGTPRAITDTRNNVVWRWDADAFGTWAPEPNGHRFVFNLRFPGQYYDQETSLHYNYYRDYDPSTGRYLEADPIGLAGGVNTYAYVGANPLSYVDPEGLHPLLGVLLRLLGIGLSANSIVNDPVPMIGGVGAAGRAARPACKDVIEGIATPYGVANQSQNAAAIAARAEVEGGATLYRIGTTGKSHAAEAQFWSLQHPLSPGYATKYGLPVENVLNANFIEAASLRPGSSFVTRPAPGIGSNAGGGIEVVVPSGGVQMKWFAGMP